MKLTAHGHERIRGRTKLLGKDVLAIISGGAVVSLGFTDKGHECLLFYSPPDSGTKIAVVSENRARLISILERYYKLPKEIRQPNAELNKEARNALATFILEGSKNKVRPNLVVKIEVQVNRRREFVQDCGNYPFETAQNLESALAAVWQKLEPIVKLVEENRDRVRGRIRYRICFFKGDTVQCLKLFIVPHKTAKRLQVT